MKNTKKAFLWIVRILQKNKIPFQITGGLAAKIYGAKRAVNDIDIDVSETDIKKIVYDVKKYIIFGPRQHKDKKWDLKLLTLNYRGQKIDIGGAGEAKIFDGRKKVWRNFPANLATAEIHNIYGAQVPVVKPENLIEYKKLLSGKHQKEDIATIQKFFKESKTIVHFVGGFSL